MPKVVAPISRLTNPMRTSMERVISGSAGERGGRCMTSISGGSKASASDSVTAETMFTHRIWLAVTGRDRPASRANKITPASPIFVGRMNSSDFLMLSNTARPSRTARAMVAKLSSVSTRSAASRAASVPRRPIATPMSAALSAGASFTPSPVMATSSPSACSARTSRSLCSGLARAMTSVWSKARRKAASSSGSMRAPSSGNVAFSPICAPMAAAVAAWSPVIIFTRSPARWHSATAATASSRGGSIRPARPSRVNRGVMSATVSCAISEAASQRASASTRKPDCAARSMAASQSDCTTGAPFASSVHKASTCSGAPLSRMNALPWGSRCSVAM